MSTTPENPSILKEVSSEGQAFETDFEHFRQAGCDPDLIVALYPMITSSNPADHMAAGKFLMAHRSQPAAIAHDRGRASAAHADPRGTPGDLARRAQADARRHPPRVRAERRRAEQAPRHRRSRKALSRQAIPAHLDQPSTAKQYGPTRSTDLSVTTGAGRYKSVSSRLLAGSADV